MPRLLPFVPSVKRRGREGMMMMTERNSSSRRMGNQRRKVLLVGFAIALLLGTAVYFRLWSIDSSFTSDDREILRQQFERANMEAMDESAEWRMKYDGEADKTRQCQEELSKIKGALASVNERLSMLHKDNLGLQKQVETTTQNCNCDRTTTQH